jgi:hypothetical protein
MPYTPRVAASSKERLEGILIWMSPLTSAILAKAPSEG